MDAIQRFRRFNRFYTRILGLFSPKLRGCDQTMVEGRILFEVSSNPGISSADLMRLLDMDRGHLSRNVNKLIKQGLLTKTEKHAGRRAIPLTLTNAGKKVMATLNSEADRQVMDITSELQDQEKARLVYAMGEIERLLSGHESKDATPVIRAAEPGDMGWIIRSHAEAYGKSHGFDSQFEKYVLLGLADFARNESIRSRLWIAEMNGVPVGSMGVVENDSDLAQLRWLLVLPEARGSGLGRTLLNKALEFCRDKEYPGAFLWTLESLPTALKLYKSTGFECTAKVSGEMGGVSCVEQRWDIRFS